MTTLGLTITDLTTIETNEGLQTALDRKLLRLREAARCQWESRFADPDPSDACVSVRIVAADAPAVVRKGTRGSGPVKSTRKIRQGTKLSLPRFAH